jgi:hypothetical protein
MKRRIKEKIREQKVIKEVIQEILPQSNLDSEHGLQRRSCHQKDGFAVEMKWAVVDPVEVEAEDLVEVEEVVTKDY